MNSSQPRKTESSISQGDSSNCEGSSESESHLMPALLRGSYDGSFQTECHFRKMVVYVSYIRGQPEVVRRQNSLAFRFLVSCVAVAEGVLPCLTDLLIPTGCGVSHTSQPSSSACPSARMWHYRARVSPHRPRAQSLNAATPSAASYKSQDVTCASDPPATARRLPYHLFRSSNLLQWLTKCMSIGFSHKIL